jgi:hypothetical protein
MGPKQQGERLGPVIFRSLGTLVTPNSTAGAGSLPAQHVPRFSASASPRLTHIPLRAVVGPNFWGPELNYVGDTAQPILTAYCFQDHADGDTESVLEHMSFQSDVAASRSARR